MAGAGSRFHDIGILKPKHEIIVNGITLFERSMLSLSEFFGEIFLFVVRKDNYSAVNISELCKKIGIRRFEIDELTDGQTRTVIKAGRYIDPSDAIVVYNIDTAIESGEIKKSSLDGFDGFILCFVAKGDHWSFIKPSDTEPYTVVRVAEKVRIPKLATVGFYYFERFSESQEIALTYQDEIKQQYRELYIAPIYQYLIDFGKKIGYCIIDENKITNLGTPAEIQSIDANFVRDNIE
ncbi:MAG: hypothetical protein LBD40_02795 [Puniceicoccales bacterium]|jgi:dTDP-glucose pyrophosphorylase|nr:hypothetical protein [Puniceicoccales bacterium]